MTTMVDSSMVVFALIGMAAGLLSGLLGIGGGVVIIPALIYFAGFDQHRATGTSLAVLLPPIGIGAAIEYYRHGAVDVRAAAIIAVCVIVFAWLSALLATRVPGDYLRLLFGLFIIGLGGTMAFDAVHKLGWL